MFILNDSLTVVLNGDWNKLYTQPDWIAENVFEKNEIEIQVSGQGAEYTLTYNVDGVGIIPEQDRIVFTVRNINEEAAVSYLCNCVTNFIAKAHTPEFRAYGLNIEFVGEDSVPYDAVVDTLGDTSAIIDSGCEIIATEIKRILQCKGKIINMDTKFNNRMLHISFNEHTELQGKMKTEVRIDVDAIQSFIVCCVKILSNLGYDLEGVEVW